MNRQPRKGMKRQRKEYCCSSSPDETPRKRAKVEKPEPQNPHVEDLRVKVLKRRVMEDEEGSSSTMKKRRKLEPRPQNGEMPFTSDTSKESCSSSRSDGALPSTNVRRMKKGGSPDEQPLRVKVLKRKVMEDEEGSSSATKKRRQLELRPDDGEMPSTSTSTSTSDTGSCDNGICSFIQSGIQSCIRSCIRSCVTFYINSFKPLTEKMSRQKSRDSQEEIRARRAAFKNKYKQGKKLGQGGHASVFAGHCKADKLPVAIKHIPSNCVFSKAADKNGNQVSVEVAVMSHLTDQTAVGTSAPVSLLDWYDLGNKLIIVMERPTPAEDLMTYISNNGGSLQEEEAKMIMKQLIDAAKELEDKRIFHRDIKLENILIETRSDTQRVRLIDFGLSCFVGAIPLYFIFLGTFEHIPPEWYNIGIYRPGSTTVWQMGVVLYEMLHKDVLFETRAFLKDERKISSALSGDCQDLLRCCLTESSIQRPSLEELRHHPWLR